MVYRTIFDILMYCFEACVFLYYANAFFERKYKKSVVLFFSFFAYMFLFAVYGFGYTLINAIVWPLINAMLLLLLYNSKILTVCFHAFIMAVMMISSEWIVISLTSTLFEWDFNAFKDNLYIYILQAVLHKFLYCFLCLIISKSLGKSRNKSKSMPFFWGMMIMPVASLGMLVLLHSITLTQQLSNGVQIGASIMSLLLLFANLIVFAIYEYGLTTASELYELKTIQQQEDIDKTYLEVLEKNNDNMNSFIHDTKNHFENILGLTDEAPVKEYVNGVRNDLIAVSSVPLTKNKMLDVIISKYRLICETKHINFKVDAKTANLRFMKTNDMATVLNNLLDNSVEAAAKCKDPVIKLKMHSVNKAFQVLQITNSCCEEPLIKNGQLITQKEHKKLHGFGMKNVQRVIELYNGKMEFEYNAATEVFEVVIIFPVKSE